MLKLIISIAAALIPLTHTSVIDGDTFRTTIDSKPVKVRLTCVDAPESKQRLGAWARQQLETLLDSGTVTIEPVGKSYDRVVANVYINGESVSAKLAAEGVALPYSTYKKNCPADWDEVVNGARQAKLNHLGIYADPIDIPAWEYRRNNLLIKLERTTQAGL